MSLQISLNQNISGASMNPGGGAIEFKISQSLSKSRPKVRKTPTSN